MEEIYSSIVEGQMDMKPDVSCSELEEEDSKQNLRVFYDSEDGNDPTDSRTQKLFSGNPEKSTITTKNTKAKTQKSKTKSQAKMENQIPKIRKRHKRVEKCLILKNVPLDENGIYHLSLGRCFA